jgi:methionyl-tRNA synthetase
LRAIWVAGNEYLQSAAPWTAFKEDPDRAAAITRFALNLIPFYAGLSAPFIPDARPPWPTRWTLSSPGPTKPRRRSRALPPGHAFTVPDVLFAKIADEDREGWAERFAGVRT